MGKARAAEAAQVSLDVQRFVGKKFLLAGRFSDYHREAIEKLIELDGGEVVDSVSQELDFLIVGEPAGKTTLAQKQVDKLARTGAAAIEVVPRADFCQRIGPDPVLTEAMLRAGPPAQERWRHFQMIDQPASLAGVSLRGADLSGFWLFRFDFTGLDLRDCRIEECTGMKLANANLEGATFHRCHNLKAPGARLVRATLHQCSIWELTGADCTESNMEGVLINGHSAVGAVFVRANMNGARLTTAKLAGADFTEAHLVKADLSRTDLGKAVLKGAVLHGADLSRASLIGVDLAKADLTGAILVGADLTGACLDGADLTDANVTDCLLEGVDTGKAVGLSPLPKVRVGPHLAALDDFADQARRVKLEAHIKLVDGEIVAVELVAEKNGKVITPHSPKRHRWDRSAPKPKTAALGLIEVVRPFLKAHLDLDSVKVRSQGGPFGGKKLHQLARAAFCEAFGMTVPTGAEAQARIAADRTAGEKQRDAVLAELRSGQEGVKRWNARPAGERHNLGPYHKANLSGADLSEVDLLTLDFGQANFEKSSLVRAKLRGSYRKARFIHSDLGAADLTGADLREADLSDSVLRASKLQHVKCKGASLRNADLTGADVSFANLCGANLTGAKLTGVAWQRAEFDEQTVWPAGFSPPAQLIWKGKSIDPRRARPAVPAPVAAPAGPKMSLVDFMARLPRVVDGGRLGNALSMLKAERFQLYNQVEDDKLAGIIRSQSSDTRVYACKLAADGTFSCGTQNLRVCGGLGGAICKHLLVLIVGLARSGKVDLEQTYQWVVGSRSQRPIFDKDEATALFLRYKGAEAGEIDWRPTETIPEDYYSL